MLKEFSYPNTPTLKFEALFVKLYQLQKEDGEKLWLQKEFYDGSEFRKLFFASISELEYYLDALVEEGLIWADGNRHQGISSVFLTLKGLNYYRKLHEEGVRSNKCFIAMAFDPIMVEVRATIKQALRECGFMSQSL